MIYLYSGTPGSGKTLAAVKKICTHKRGKVITNIPISECFQPSDFHYVDTCDLTASAVVSVLQGFTDVKEGSHLLVIDEAQVILGNREWNAQGRSYWNRLFMQHRKLKLDVILVTQWAKMIDKQIQALIEYEWIFRRLSRIGTFGVVLFFLTFGEKYIVVERYKPLDMYIGRHISMASKRFFKAYDSYSTVGFDFGSVGLPDSPCPSVLGGSSTPRLRGVEELPGGRACRGIWSPLLDKVNTLRIAASNLVDDIRPYSFDSSSFSDDEREVFKREFFSVPLWRYNSDNRNSARHFKQGKSRTNKLRLLLQGWRDSALQKRLDKARPFDFSGKEQV